MTFILLKTRITYQVFHRCLPVLQSKFDPGESKIEEHDPIMNKILLKCSL